MKTIKIKSLKLTNFKGIRKLELTNLSRETFIYGDNGTGKTSVFDAFTFLLFGKDSTDRKDFEIKTLDKNNNVIPKIDHEVEAIIEVNGQEITLRRILREKWVTKRGSMDAEFNGNETVYEWNGVPMNAGEYSNKICGIVDEKVFKMITNPLAFNSLKWQDQRDVLIDMSGNITNEDVAIGNADFEHILTKLVNISFDEFKKHVKASILKSKNEIKTIPTRIDEVERSKPEPQDFEALKTKLVSKNEEIEKVNIQIGDALKGQQADLEKQKEIQAEIYSIQTEVTSEKYKIQNESAEAFNLLANGPRSIQRLIDTVDGEINANESAIATRQSRISGHKHALLDVEKRLKALREDWAKENAKQFEMDESNCECPTCKRAFDASDVEEKRKDLEGYFVSNKTANLKSINERGAILTAEKNTLETQIKELNSLVEANEIDNKSHWEKRADLTAKLKEVSLTKTQIQIYDELLKEKESFFSGKNAKIEELRTELNNRPSSNNSELKQQLASLNIEKDSIKNVLSLEAQIVQSNKRIEELSNEERALAQAIADMEREMFIVEAFEKEKSTRIEDSVNNRFQFVNFKLFETQINGGEIPTCKALINGVPFSDANTASKINAGLDIINTLCMYYQANAPIFIDNRESIIDLIPTESQIINLIVSEEDKKLRVEDKPMSYTQHIFKNKFETETA